MFKFGVSVSASLKKKKSQYVTSHFILPVRSHIMRANIQKYLFVRGVITTLF